MSSREKQLIGIVVVVIALIALYYVAYRPMVIKSVALDEEIESLNTTAIELRKEYNKIPEYKKGILDARDKINSIEDLYPAGLSQEAVFKLIFDIEDEFNDIEFSDVSFSSKEILLYSDENNDENTLFATRQTMNSDVVIAYETLKGFLAFIRDYPDRTVLSNLNLNLIEKESNIGFTLTANLYAIEGGGRVYIAPKFEEVPIGKEQIINSNDVDEQKDVLEVDRPSDAKSDIFISLNPVQADIAAQIIGLSTDNNQSTYVENDVNDVVQALVRIYKVDENYFVNYDISGSYQANIPFDMGEVLELDLYSTARVDENDEVGMTLTVFNETSHILYINKKDEDKDDPRFRLNVSEGIVKME